MGRRSVVLIALWVLATGTAAALDLPWLAAACGVGGGLLVLRGAGRAWPGYPPSAYGGRRDVDAARGAAALTSALEAVPDGVVVLDRADRVCVANRAGRELLGLDGAVDSTRSLPDFVDWPQLAAAIAASRESRLAREFEAVLARGGHSRTVAVTVRVTDDDQALVVLRDLTRLRQLESHRRDFVANVSHELKTPLAAIRGFVETLVDDPEVPVATRQHFLQRVLRQVGRLGTLVSDLLTLSRLDEERAPAPTDPVDLADVVGEAVRDLQPLAEAKGLQLGLQVLGQPAAVVAEREALRQVASNLIENAIKYTAAGSVSVEIRHESGWCQLDVIDTGLGLSPSDRQRVFERFYRVDKARSTELGGTGLGLSIVKNTVQAMGGEVGVRSVLGAGSRFWVRLPAVRPAQASPAARPESAGW